ncbi:MAG: prephenate dehydrogenase [Clostridia bacterium]
MKIGIIGLGLIGGSMGRAILKKTDNEVLGLDIDEEVEKTALVISAMTEKLTDEKVKELDVLMLALYPTDVEPYLEKYCKLMKPNAIIMDLCGNKRKVCELFENYAKKFPSINFVGAHPMAGREFIGIKHSMATLFEHASMILVNINSNIETIAKIKALSLSLGFNKVVITTAENHDKIIAYTSQLAHIVSSSYVKSNTADEYFGFSAGSFRDMTRVARLSPTMWSELMLDNKDNLIREIDEIIDHLSEYKSAMVQSDKAKMETLLSEGNEKKLALEKLKCFSEDELNV